MLAHAIGEPLGFTSDGIDVPAGIEICPHDLLKGRSRYHQARAFRVQAAMGLVAHDQAVIAVVDDEPLRNAVDRVFQGLLRCAQLLFDF